MDVGVIASLAGALTGLAGVLGAYHIAARSGIFAKPHLGLQVGPRNSSSKYRHPVAVAFGIPQQLQPADQFVFELPILLVGGREPVRNVRLQMFYPHGRDGSASPAFAEHYFAKSFGGDGRRVVHLREGTLVEHDIPLVLRNQAVVISCTVVYRANEIQPLPVLPEEVQFDDMTFSLRAENHEGEDLKLLFTAIRSESVETLAKATLVIGVAARMRRGLRVFREPIFGLSFLALSYNAARSYLLLLQPFFTRATIHEGTIVAFSVGAEGEATGSFASFIPVRLRAWGE